MNQFEKDILRTKSEYIIKGMIVYLILWLFSTVIPIVGVAAHLIWSNSFTLFIKISTLTIWSIETVFVGTLLVMSYITVNNYARQANSED
ncbi:hypothetical protein HCA50_10995 [Listeria innocua]|uniref:hypothetical protein n=1 Tax=Listeria innocua TaxID=1642 RepID=UPI001626D5F1|nr:hypothetical protein [Listeria innocua]MBC1671201.1 hypothetical protein [Listeria welshimeri]MBC1904040.1 hypothetical protein [Listeria innocua]